MKTLYFILLAAFLFFANLNLYAQVPALNSNPGSAFVLLLDLDGHTDSSGWWGTARHALPGRRRALPCAG